MGWNIKRRNTQKSTSETAAKVGISVPKDGSWHDPRNDEPPSGVPILFRLQNGSVLEGHYIKNANKYVKNVNRFRIHKSGRTVPILDVKAWTERCDREKKDIQVPRV